VKAEFTTLVQQLIVEQGKEALFNAAKCKALLADYTRGEYKKESRLLLQAIETGVAEAVSNTNDIASCKAQAVQKLQDEYFLAENIAADVVDMLASVLTTQEASAVANPKCANCGKELQDEWKTCPFCSTEVATPRMDANSNAKNDDAPKVGGKGPAGGLIFYDKGTNSNGWRYLEAAPVETEFKAEWGAYEKDVKGTDTALGTGKQNTQIIVDYLQHIGESRKAAQLCDLLRMNGYNNWYLPSKDELNLMYKNLKQKGWGGFSNGWYWSSSQYNSDYSRAQRFSDGSQYTYNFNGNKDCIFSARAIRAFYH
jgi:predicted Zn-ribbon and HTH transcriptional regulator